MKSCLRYTTCLTVGKKDLIHYRLEVLVTTQCYMSLVQVNKEFSQVLQFVVTYLLDELLSPVVTPFILYFSLRRRATDVVDFLRNFTIDVSG